MTVLLETGDCIRFSRAYGDDAEQRLTVAEITNAPPQHYPAHTRVTVRSPQPRLRRIRTLEELYALEHIIVQEVFKQRLRTWCLVKETKGAIIVATPPTDTAWKDLAVGDFLMLEGHDIEEHYEWLGLNLWLEANICAIKYGVNLLVERMDFNKVPTCRDRLVLPWHLLSLVTDICLHNWNPSDYRNVTSNAETETFIVCHKRSLPEPPLPL